MSFQRTVDAGFLQDGCVLRGGQPCLQRLRGSPSGESEPAYLLLAACARGAVTVKPAAHLAYSATRSAA
ncbi:hypothetical protein ADK90_36605 [Streptomyces sp. XY413]|nr:hypothetical protein ADK90_36605 [Streptomyces sp. XY413]